MSLLIEVASPYAIDRPTPVRIPIDAARMPSGPVALEPVAGGPTIPAQTDANGIVALLNGIAANEKVQYRVVSAENEPAGVVLVQGDDKLAIDLPEGPFTVYHFGKTLARPFLWPVYGPGQKRVTRNFPMEDVEGEQHDHPHHRSLWTAFDEVNGVNNWHEGEGHGYTKHVEFIQIKQGPVFGGFLVRNLWTSHSGEPLLEEMRSVRVYNVGPQYRLLDYDITLTAIHGDVTFNDTKEAGILAIRVATTMDGARGGLIENSEGGKGEAACWGKEAAWCDYSGPVDGETLGIAMMDHPSNHCFPTRWHARDYGLISTNPFSQATFGAGDPTPFTLRNHEKVHFQYRVLIHSGGVEQGRIQEAYAAFTTPIEARVEDQ